MYQNEVFNEILFSLDSNPWELDICHTDFLAETCFPDSISSPNTDCEKREIIIPKQEPPHVDFKTPLKRQIPPEFEKFPASELHHPPQICPQQIMNPPVVFNLNQTVLPYRDEPIHYQPQMSPMSSMSSMPFTTFHPTMPMPPEEKRSTVCPQLIQDYDFFLPRAAPSFRTTPRLALDVSKPFSAPKYSEIFHQHAASLLVDKHPQLTESDLKQIEQTGFLYFMKNVKIIVPKIGPWRFLSHVRSGSSNDRSYNLVGFPIRCKVKEWMQGGDLWRMYHFVKGKTPKARQ